MAGATHREFFAVRTVAETLAGFRPQRRTAVETVRLEDAHGRVPAEPVRAPHDLPGFARSTVDGYAVRAADTYGASEGLPSYLDVTGAVAMGRAPSVAVTPGRAVAMPTGGVIPDGADAVVMVEHTQEAMADTIEVLRPVAPGDGLVRADEDARAGDELLPAGRPLRAQDLGLLAAPGIWAHGIALRPGKPTLLADCGGVPVIGLPGNPRSALVVFRLVGMGIVRLVGGVTQPPPAASARARLARDLPSAPGRLDVVQV